jgi:hypothetical protein
MLNKENRVFVRLEDQNQAPDWYRLRDLYAEQAADNRDISLPPADTRVYGRSEHDPDVDLVLRGRLLLTGSRGRPAKITGSTHAALLASLASKDAPLTGTGSALLDITSQMVAAPFGATRWQLAGRANSRRFSACWQSVAPNGRVLTEARIRVKIKPRPGHGDTLLITVDTLLTDPRRPALSEIFGKASPKPNGFAEDSSTDEAWEALTTAANYKPTPFIGLGALRKVMLDITGTLWGAPAEALSTSVLRQPLGPPALLDITIFGASIHRDTPIPPLNQRIDFGTAQPIPGNTPDSWANLSPIQPDRDLLSSPAAQALIIREWLIQLGIDIGYQDIEQEVARWTDPAE